MNFLNPIHTYVSTCLERGEHVLVHCKWGAHRSAIPAVSSMMHVSGLGYEDARKAGRRCRPVMHPYGLLEKLL